MFKRIICLGIVLVVAFAFVGCSNADLQNQIDELSGVISELEQRINEKDEKIADLEEVISNLEKEITDLEEEISDLEDEILGLEREKEQLQKELSMVELNKIIDNTIAEFYNENPNASIREGGGFAVNWPGFEPINLNLFFDGEIVYMDYGWLTYYLIEKGEFCGYLCKYQRIWSDSLWKYVYTKTVLGEVEYGKPICEYVIEDMEETEMLNAFNKLFGFLLDAKNRFFVTQNGDTYTFTTQRGDGFVIWNIHQNPAIATLNFEIKTEGGRITQVEYSCKDENVKGSVGLSFSYGGNSLKLPDEFK